MTEVTNPTGELNWLLDGLVERDFSVRSLQLKTRIPCAAIWAVEAATERVRVAECGVDDPIVRYAEHKLVDADSRQQVVLG